MPTGPRASFDGGNGDGGGDDGISFREFSSCSVNISLGEEPCTGLLRTAHRLKTVDAIYTRFCPKAYALYMRMYAYLFARIVYAHVFIRRYYMRRRFNTRSTRCVDFSLYSRM